MFGFGKKYPFIVTVQISGRHPYLQDDRLDMFKGLKTERVRIMARNYDDAERRAFDLRLVKTKGWSYTVIGIKREGAGLRPGRSDKGAFQLER